MSAPNDDEKARLAAEKAARKAAFAAANPGLKTDYNKKPSKKELAKQQKEQQQQQEAGATASGTSSTDTTSVPPTPNSPAASPTIAPSSSNNNNAPAATPTAATTTPSPAAATASTEEDEKARKAAEKAARKAQFAAANPNLKTEYTKPVPKKSNNNTAAAAATASAAETPSTTTSTPPPAPSPTTGAAAATSSSTEEDEKAKKAAEKAARKAAFAAANPDKNTEYNKPAAKKGNNNNTKQQAATTTAAVASVTPTSTTPVQTSATAAPTPTPSTAPAPAPAPVAAPKPIPAYAQPEPLSNLRLLSNTAPLGLGHRTVPVSLIQKSTAGGGNGGSDPYDQQTATQSNSNANISETIHPRVASFGALLASRSVVGGNARLLGCLDVLSTAAVSFVEANAVPGDLRFLSILTAYLRHNVRFLETCRPFTSGMKQVTDRLLRELDRTELSAKGLKAIFDDHRNELQESIVDTAAGTANIIQENDIVLTYGRSSAIEMALCSLCRDPKAPTFSVIIVDSAPHFEGRALLQRLRDAGASAVSYCMLDSVVMATNKATKVLLGASAMLPNGQVLGRAGTAMVALAAKYTRVPVFCVCESYKFTANMWQGASAGLDAGFAMNSTSSGNNSVLNSRNRLMSSPSFNNNNNNSNNNNIPSNTLEQEKLQQVPFFGVSDSKTNNGGGVINTSTISESSSSIFRNANYSSSNKNNNGKNHHNNNGSNVNYDLSPPGTVNFVVSEHEVHEPTAIAAVVRMRDRI